MKKSNAKKLYFNSLSVTELNAAQMRHIIAGGETNGTSTIRTQTGPPDKFSTVCAEVVPTLTSEVKEKK